MRRFQRLIAVGLALGLLLGTVRPSAGCIAIPRQSFKMAPKGRFFQVEGPAGTQIYARTFPTLAQIIPKGGTLSKYTASLPATERKRDLVFAEL